MRGARPETFREVEAEGVQIWHSRVMRALLIALLPAAIAFAVAEIVCRPVLHLPDQTVPLIVFPSRSPFGS